MKIYGRNAVSEAIKSGNTIDRLVAAKGQKDVGAQRIIDDAKSRGIKVFFYDKEVLDRETGGKKHQGFVAEVTDFKYCELDDILDYAAERLARVGVLVYSYGLVVLVAHGGDDDVRLVQPMFVDIVQRDFVVFKIA